VFQFPAPEIAADNACRPYQQLAAVVVSCLDPRAPEGFRAASIA